jgi:hypothetical protein
MGRTSANCSNGSRVQTTIWVMRQVNDPTPSPDHPTSTWTWYVASRKTRDERNAALALCPDDKRERVREWVRELFEEAAKVRKG